MPARISGFLATNDGPAQRLPSAELQQLASDRIEDARVLLDNGRWTTAYYLVGYAVESVSMDTATLVNEQVDEDQRFVDRLGQSGFDVVVAFWVLTSEEGLWFLYIASGVVDTDGPAAAYRNVYSELSRSQVRWISRSDIKLVGSQNPIAVDAIAHQSTRLPTVCRGRQLGSMIIEEAYIYSK